jgi:hypothetical protein
LVERGLADYEEEKRKIALNDQRGSKLGAQLSDSTTKKVIVIVLVMLIIVPLLIFVPTDKGPTVSLAMMDAVNSNPHISPEAKVFFVQELYEIQKSAYNTKFMVELYASNISSQPLVLRSSLIDSLRSTALTTLTSNTTVQGTAYETLITFNYMVGLRQSSMFSIILTIFVAIGLIVGTVVLNSDAERLVISPIEV